jgi:glutaredoxin
MFAIPDEQFPTTITEVMVIVPEPNPEDPDEKCPSCEGFKRALDRNKIPYIVTTKAEAPTQVQEQIEAHKIKTAPTVVANGTVVAAGGLQIPVVRRIIAAYKPAAVAAGV